MALEFFLTLVTGITALKWDTLLKIISALAFINTFLSLAITQTFSRKAFISKRWALLLTLVLLWSAVIGVLFDTVMQIFVQSWLFWGSTIGIIFWILGLILFLYTLYSVFAVDQICYTITCCLEKNGVFDTFPTSFSRDGVQKTCLDKKIQQAILADTGHKDRLLRHPRYPLILIADESWRPWCIAEDFAVNALDEDAGVIWFWFSRPHDPDRLLRKVRLRNNQMKEPVKTGKTPGGKKLIPDPPPVIHIDCFDPGKNLNMNAGKHRICFGCKFRSGCSGIYGWLKAKTGMYPVDNVFYADPRNPDDIDLQYSRAVKLMKKKFNKTKLCVVFDPVSDFLYFSDIEMASRYLRVAMAWEEKTHVHSLYLMRTGVLDPKLEEYIQWYANTVVILKSDDKSQKMTVQGLENVPRTDPIDYDMNCGNPEPDNNPS